MPKTRQEVAREVQAVYKEAEVAAERSAAAAARCLAVLIEARGRARLPAAAGADVMAAMARGSESAMRARFEILAAHPMLDSLARDLGLVGFGPDKERVPNEPFFGSAATPLRVVGDAA